MRRSPRLFLVPLFVLAMLFSSASAQAAPTIGISQSFRDFGLNLSTGPAYNPDRDVSRSLYWGPLGIQHMRVIVPWDIAGRAPSDGRRQEFENWLKRTKELGAEPFVVFGPTERSPSTDTAHTPPHFSNVATRTANTYYPGDGGQAEAVMLPPVTDYRAAINDFLATWGPNNAGKATWGEVRTIGAWNEPNRAQINMVLPGSLTGGAARIYLVGGKRELYENTSCVTGTPTDTNCGPLAVARFWNNAYVEMNAVCGACTVVAGEFDSDGQAKGKAYWDTYADKIASITTARPKAISFHGHHDVEAPGSHGVNDCTSGNPTNCITNNFNAWLSARGGAWADRGAMQIWDTEVGVQHAHGTSPTSDDTAQNNGFNFLIGLENSNNVSRIYYYNFQHQGGVNDRSLIDSFSGPLGVNTRQRPIWESIRCRNGCTPWSVPAPVATSEQASNVQQTDATLSGSILANGANLAYFFEYGPTVGYGASAPSPRGFIPGSSTTPVGVQVPIGGLQAGTTYHYRLAATNYAGGATVYGADQTFRTKEDGPGTGWSLRNNRTGSRWSYYVNSAGGISELSNPGGSSPWQANTLGGNVRAGTSPSVTLEPASDEHSVYYVDTAGAIAEWVYQPGANKWVNYNLGGSVRPATNPETLIAPASNRQWVYYANTSGSISELFYQPGSPWQSNTLPASVRPGTTPSVTLEPGSEEHSVYYVETTGTIAEWVYQPGPNKWVYYNLGGAVMPATSPETLIAPASGHQWVYYVNTAGAITELYYQPGVGWGGGSLGGNVKPGTSPVATLDPVTEQHSVYYLNTTGGISQLVWNGSSWSGSTVAASAPGCNSLSAVRDYQGSKQWVYCNRDGKSIWEFEWTGSAWATKVLP